MTSTQLAYQHAQDALARLFMILQPNADPDKAQSLADVFLSASVHAVMSRPDHLLPTPEGKR